MVEDAFVEKHQGIHGLVLGRGGDLALHGEVSEECLNLGFGGQEVGAGLHPVEADESSDPLHIGALGMDGVMMETEDPPDILDQGRWRTVWCVSHKKNAVLAP
jgi:hypothetical protein